MLGVFYEAMARFGLILETLLPLIVVIRLIALRVDQNMVRRKLLEEGVSSSNWPKA